MFRKVATLVLASLLAASAACGKEAQKAVAPGPGIEPAAIDTTSALSVSVERLNEVQSGRAQFSWVVTSDRVRVEGSGTYAVQAPTNLELETHYRGQATGTSPFREANDSNLLALGDRVFIKTPSLDDGWVVFTAKEFDADWKVLQRLVVARSPLNYSMIASGLTDTATVGSDKVEGRAYLHLRGVADSETVMNALADTYGSQGQVMFVHRYSGPLQVDVWLDPETYLPKKLTAGGTANFLGVSNRLSVSVDYRDLNTVGKLSAAPQRYKTLAELR